MSDESVALPVDPKELEARILILELRAREVEAENRLAEALAKRRELRQVGNNKKGRQKKRKGKMGKSATGRETGGE